MSSVITSAYKQEANSAQTLWKDSGRSSLDIEGISKSSCRYRMPPNQRLQAKRDARGKLKAAPADEASPRPQASARRAAAPREPERRKAGGTTHAGAGPRGASAFPLGTSLSLTGLNDSGGRQRRGPSPSRHTASPPCGPGTPSRRRLG